MLPYFAACQVLTPLNELCVFETAFWEMRGCAGILRKIIDRTWTDMPYDFWQCLSFVLGSPPHTRGKVKLQPSHGIYSRITPAHAGKSFCCKAVHFVKVGSPPHTRGKGERGYLRGLRKRITPAHAGKRLRQQANRRRQRDHPRTRGEKNKLADGTSSISGSPPHTRGKASRNLVGDENERITPAHAGKSC